VRLLREHRLDVAPQVRVVGAHFVEEREPPRPLARESQKVDAFDLLEAFGFHGREPVPDSSLSSHALATCQSLCTVSGDTCSAAAISATVSPAKYLSSTTWLLRRSNSASATPPAREG
jgi:hypothetical protein